jgi:hypothetical protein
MEKILGKITDVKFGYGGYQDTMIGISFTLEGKGGGCGDFWGEWAFKHDNAMKWTEQERINGLGKMVMKINNLLQEAKVTSVDKLKNIPIEITFENLKLKSWRVLTEVL